MILFVDTIHHYQNPALQTDDGFCRLRIYGANVGTVIVLSELAENLGVSVTNASAALATEIAEPWRPYRTIASMILWHAYIQKRGIKLMG